jgi:hypothetical protein
VCPGHHQRRDHVSQKRSHVPSTIERTSDSPEQFVQSSHLKHVTGCARPKCLFNDTQVGIHAENEHLYGFKFLPKNLYRFDAVNRWHLDVYHSHIRALPYG